MSPIGLLRIVIGNCQGSSIGITAFWEIAIYFVSSIVFCKNGWGREQNWFEGFSPHHLSISLKK